MFGNKKMLFLVCSLFAWMMDPVFSHGRMMDPPARNSMWRFGFSNPVNYNDNELYCGGKMVQWVRNGGRCGVCGDPWHGSRPHETGGKYANNIISRTYREGELINVAVHLTANHLGWFEFRLCPVVNRNQKVDQQCLDKYLLRGIDGKTTKFEITRGKYNSFFNFTLQLPNGLVCQQCVLQWKYKTGNTWDKDGKSGLYCLGCGPQEEFYNCADVSIKPQKTADTKQTSKKKQSNSNRLPPLETKKKATKSVRKDRNQKFNIMATTMAPPQKYTARKTFTKMRTSQPRWNRKRKGWLLAGRNNNAMTPKHRGDTPVDRIYSKSKKRQPTQKRNNMATNSNPLNLKTSTKSSPVSSPESIWRWWVKKISPPARGSNRLKENPFLNTQQKLSRKQTTTQPTTSLKTTQATTSPCSKKNPDKNKSKSVISPVRPYHLGWWRQQSLQSPAQPVSPIGAFKPVLKCRALISLSGGMDSWCFANCNANYCPPNICQCQRDVSYVPLYPRNDFLDNNDNLNQHRSSPQKVWPEPNTLRVRSEGTFRRNPRLSPVVRRQYYDRSEAATTLSCHAVGLYSRIVHFDDWCNRNCFAFMCPSFICRCTRR